MKYAIIICPNCKHVKGVELHKKTTTCSRCGKKHHLNKLVLQYKTDSLQQLQQVIGLLNADKDGRSEEFKQILKTMNAKK